MNAKERRQNRRFRQYVKAGRKAGQDRTRADNAELQVALLRDRLAEVEDATVARIGAAEGDLAALRVRLAAAEADLGNERIYRELAVANRYRAESEIAAWRDQAQALKRDVDRLSAEDRDASKLRRRLREAHDEIAQLHERVRRAEAAATSEPWRSSRRA